MFTKEEFMKSQGTNQEEQDALIDVTFDIFRFLEKDDKIYYTCYWMDSLKIPFIIETSKWLFSGYDVSNYKGKNFYYKQISFSNGKVTYYADSATNNFDNLFIHRDLLPIIKERMKNKKQR